jgi:hypothetical protein
MKITYTEAAQIELKAFHDRQQKLLEELIADKKVVLGDDTLEVTASDIKEESQNIITKRNISKSRYLRIQLITTTYIILGSFMIFFSLFFFEILHFFERNPTQAMIFLIGVSMIGAGVALKLIYKRRYFLYSEKTDKFISLEK